MDQHEAARPTVAVIGAGLTGLLAAHGLKKHGFEAVVFEREAGLETRRRDWTILVHWAMPILARLLPDDVLADLPTAICNPHLDFDAEVECLPCVNGVTGELLFKSPTPGARRVTRQKLRRLLAEKLDVGWGRTLVGLTAADDSVTLTFQDGPAFVADYVLGADGASSKVRELLMGPEASVLVPSDVMFATGIVKYGDSAKVKTIVEQHPVMSVYMGTSSTGGIGVMEVGDHPEDMSTWTTFWAQCWLGPTPNMQGQEAIDYVKERSKTVVEPFRSAIEWTPEGSPCFIDRMKYWVPVPFPDHGGRVTLAGDAAHPMLPFRGQGLQNAIADAGHYVEVLTEIRELSGDEAARRKAISAYGSEMVARGAQAVRQSVEEAAKAFDLNTVADMLMVRKGHGELEPGGVETMLNQNEG